MNRVTFAYNQRNSQYEIESNDFNQVKDKLLGQLTNFGQPVIEVVNANHENRSELLLVHRHDGRDLRPDYADATLRNLNKIWGRPVVIETAYEGKKTILCFDGTQFTQKELG